jgi:peptidoglycan/xylan/chitin deacetylase (PgdA/CDA1 family)
VIPLVVAGVGGAAAAGVLWGVYDPNSALFGPVIGRGPRRPVLYLTFDDGPRPSSTEPILETLAQYRVPAAFFLVGTAVRHYPDTARRIAACGHELGNHTRRHRKLHRLGPKAVSAELVGGHYDVVETVGQEPRMFRAPHGYRNPFVSRTAAQLDYQVVGWTFGVWDSARPGVETIRRRVREKLCPGAIILLHDGDGYDPTGADARGDRRETSLALPGIIQDARDAGYEFRPLGELCA